MPDTLLIPFKDRLARLTTDFTDTSIALAASQQFDNLKVIERWANDFTHDTNPASRCHLNIPYKQHSREKPVLSADQSFQNLKTIERWAGYVLDGSCGCPCSTTQRLADRCRLSIPFKDHLRDVDLTDPDQLLLAADHEFAAFKAIEWWAGLYTRGVCGCSCGYSVYAINDYILPAAAPIIVEWVPSTESGGPPGMTATTPGNQYVFIPEGIVISVFSFDGFLIGPDAGMTTSLIIYDSDINVQLVTHTVTEVGPLSDFSALIDVDNQPNVTGTMPFTSPVTGAYAAVELTSTDLISLTDESVLRMTWE